MIIYHNGINPSNIFIRQDETIIQSLNWSELYPGIIQADFSLDIGVNLGNWDLVIEDNTFGEVLSNNSITVEPSPAFINFMNPSSSSIGETISVTISGYNTNFNENGSTSFYLQSNNNTIYPSNLNVLAQNIITGSIIIPNN